MQIPQVRVRILNSCPIESTGRYVLYWMTAYRRAKDNFALDRAVWWSNELRKPLVVLEALRAGYPWASDRLHSFILDGMSDNRIQFADSPATYYPYVELAKGQGDGLVASLAQNAAVVVTDDYPCFFLPMMTAVVGRKLPVLAEAVDSNGLFPLRTTDRVFEAAVHFRRFLQKNLFQHLEAGNWPNPAPLAMLARGPQPAIDSRIVRRWRPATVSPRSGAHAIIKKIVIAHSVPRAGITGGGGAALARLTRFLDHGLTLYPERRNHPDDDCVSGLSPYLHFGHIGVHTIIRELAEREEWSPDQRSQAARGSKTGWWGMSGAAECFLDELITWRELGFNSCAHRKDYDKYESLPEWARRTLEIHERDARPFLYSLEEFEHGNTHDQLWNAAQCQLVREGRMHNYLRMLWGKKILEWSKSPRRALETMIHLNNKYAIDGRDPNSYSGIFWCLGRYDRPWPERPVFGKVRFMSSQNTRRKLRCESYLAKYGNKGGD